MMRKVKLNFIIWVDQWWKNAPFSYLLFVFKFCITKIMEITETR